jgi:hypothetical protein
MSEEEGRRFGVERDKRIFVIDIIILNRFVVGPLVANSWYSVEFPLSLEDVGNECYRSNDQEAEREQDSKEECPGRWFQNVFSVRTSLNQRCIGLWTEVSVVWTCLAIGHN